MAYGRRRRSSSGRGRRYSAPRSRRRRSSYRSSGGARRRFSRSGSRGQTVRIVLENASGGALGGGAPVMTSSGPLMAAPPLRRARF